MVTLRAGDASAEVDAEDGGRLASLVVGGAQRLLTRESVADGLVPEEVVAWGSFLMAPWIGRLDQGRMPWRGRTYQLPVDFRGDAIHGIVKDRSWTVEEASADRVTLSCPLTDPWPFAGEVRQAITLRPGHLELVAEVHAAGEAMPASVGWHPWFARPAEGDLRVRVAATGTLAMREGSLIPTGEITPLTAETDLRDGPPLGERRLDDIYADVGAPAQVVWPDLELRIDWDQPPVNSVCVHSPTRGVCVEPQTAWPNAPALVDAGSNRTGLVIVEPGAPLRARTTWSWDQP